MRRRASVVLLLPLLFVLASCNRDPKVQAQRYVDNGNRFFQKDKYKEASIMYRRALQKDQRFGEAYYRLGLTEIKLGRYGDAVRALRRAVELQPANTDAASRLGDIFLVAYAYDRRHPKEYLHEIEDLRDRLLKRDPNSYDGLRLAGHLALINNDLATASKDLEAANKIKPLQPEVVGTLFQVLANDKRFDEAEKLARDMIAKDKTYAPMYDLLYLLYARRNMADEAEKVLRLKVDNNPKQGQYLLQLASFYLTQQKRPEMEQVIQRLVSRPDEIPAGHLLAGDFFLFRAREAQRALEQYQEGMNVHPKEKAAYQKRIVEVLASQGNTHDALQLIETVLKESPKDDDALAMRAGLMLYSGNPSQVQSAVNDLQSLVNRMPSNHLLRFNLARALLASNNVEQARLQLEEAVKLRPDFLPARELLARVYYLKGDKANALKAADEILAMAPNDLPAKLVRSGALLAMGDHDRARQELGQIIESNPKNTEAQYQVAYLAWLDKQYKVAQEHFEKLRELNPGDPRGLVGMVETDFAQGRTKEALDLLEAEIRKDPKRNDLRLAEANLMVRAQMYDQAAGIYQDLLKQSPRSSDLLFKLGETYRRKGDLNLAIDMFRQASAAAPNDPLPLLQLGLLMDGTGRRDQAKPIYEQILRLQPDHPVALNNLAFINAEEGRNLDEALTMAQRARAEVPGDVNIADTLGWIYIKKNLTEDALGIFRDIVKREPNNPTFHYHFALALLQKGDRPSAKKELELALRNNPSKDDLGKIKDLLTRI